MPRGGFPQPTVKKFPAHSAGFSTVWPSSALALKRDHPRDSKSNLVTREICVLPMGKYERQEGNKPAGAAQASVWRVLVFDTSLLIACNWLSKALEGMLILQCIMDGWPLSTSLCFMLVILLCFLCVGGSIRISVSVLGLCNETLHKPSVTLTKSNLSQAAMKTFSKYHQKMDS